MKTLLTRLAATALLAGVSLIAMLPVRAADTVQFSAAAYEVNEVSDGGGVAPGGFLYVGLNHTGPWDSGATVRVVVAGGTAVEGGDFMLSSTEWGTDGTAHPVNPIQLSRGFLLIALDEGLPEGDETVVLRLMDPSPDVQLGALSECTVTIRNGKPAFALSLRHEGHLYLSEGPAPAVEIRRVGDRTAASAAKLVLKPNAGDFNPDDWPGAVSAVAGRDYTPALIRVEFQPGESSRHVTLPIHDNGDVNERYRGLPAELKSFVPEVAAPGEFTLFIEDKEHPTHLDVTRTERDLLFDVEFDADFNLPEECGAERNPDDPRHIGTLPDGRMVINDLPLRVRIYLPDGRVDESFPALYLTGFGNAGLRASLWLCDGPYLLVRATSVNAAYIDRQFFNRSVIRLSKLPTTALQLAVVPEGAPELPYRESFRRPEPAPDSSDAFPVQFIRLGPSRTSATVHYTTRDVTATAGKDFEARSGTLTFAPLETEKLVTIPILADSEDEFDETLEVVVTAAEGFEELPAPMRLTILGKGPAPRLDRVKRLRDGRVLLGASELRRQGDGTFALIPIEFSTDLQTWHPLIDLLGGFNGESAVWLDPSATNAVTRYYRAGAR